MKKVLSLLLVVMSLTLFACSVKNTLVGTWKCTDYDITITFNKDGTAVYKEDGDDMEMVEWSLADDVVMFDGYETDLTFKEGQLIMNDGGEICIFKRKQQHFLLEKEMLNFLFDISMCFKN